MVNDVIFKVIIKIYHENECANDEQAHFAMDTDRFVHKPKFEEGNVEYSHIELSNGEKGSIFKLSIQSYENFIILQYSSWQLLNQMQASS